MESQSCISLSELESIAKIIAIIVGGVWAYLVFVRTRQRYPRGKLTHHHKLIPINKEEVVLRLEARIKNTGDVLIEITDGSTRLQQVLPNTFMHEGKLKKFRLNVRAGKTEIDWPMIKKYSFQLSPRQTAVEIEPGESDSFWFDFLLSTSIKKVLVYSHFQNRTKGSASSPRKIGWNLDTLISMENDSEENQPPGHPKQGVIKDDPLTLPERTHEVGQGNEKDDPEPVYEDPVDPPNSEQQSVPQEDD